MRQLTHGLYCMYFFVSRLVEQGHEVVGCEAVDKGCHEFFKEHNLQYTSFPMKACEGVVYQVHTRFLYTRLFDNT